MSSTGVSSAGMSSAGMSSAVMLSAGMSSAGYVECWVCRVLVCRVLVRRLLDTACCRGDLVQLEVQCDEGKKRAGMVRSYIAWPCVRSDEPHGGKSRWWAFDGMITTV